jgi:hypothetical protein
MAWRVQKSGHLSHCVSSYSKSVRLVQADADMSKAVKAKVRSIASADIRILVAQPTSPVRNRSDPRRITGCGERIRVRRHQCGARERFGKYHHAQRALHGGLHRGRIPARKGRLLSRWKLNKSPSRQAPVRRQCGARLTYASRMTWASPCCRRPDFLSCPGWNNRASSTEALWCQLAYQSGTSYGTATAGRRWCPGARYG